MCFVIRRAISLHTFHIYSDTDTLIALVHCLRCAIPLSLFCTHSLTFGGKEIAAINQIKYCCPVNEMNASTKSNGIDEIHTFKIDDYMRNLHRKNVASK